MRILLMLVFCFSTCYYTAAAFTGRFGVEGGLSISTNTVYCTTQPVIGNKGMVPRMYMGMAYHIPIQAHCSLSPGLIYNLGHIGLKRTVEGSIPLIDEQYLLQDLWLPFLFRFYTSEVMIDTSFFFNLGPVLAIHLFTRPTIPLQSGASSFVTVRPVGLFILLGAGVKYDFSLTNSLTLGLRYCRDLLGILYKNDPHSGNVYVHNNFISLDIGFLF